jgi:phenylalanyl-tRNA synthetase alpha chain
MEELNQLINVAKSEITAARDLKTLDHFRVQYLGKKGHLTEILKNLGKLSPEDRPLAGQKVNQAKTLINDLLVQKLSQLQAEKIEAELAKETIDVTLAGRTRDRGSIHPITKTRERLERIFSQMGFTSEEGPEIEDDYHNFQALNVPPLHPARAMQDTFYFSDGLLLRTQMSPVQIRVMKANPPPLRMIAIGRVYRRDFDVTHTPMFHQMEGLVIDKNINFATLKGMMIHFLREFFADLSTKEIPIRFRPSYFPFTEPSAEVDMGCVICDMTGCRVCKGTGWLEVLGCGMVHPNVLKEGGIDVEQYTGLAFGIGVDRLTMLRYGISDLRTLFENDIRFLKQF